MTHVTLRDSSNDCHKNGRSLHTASRRSRTRRQAPEQYIDKPNQHDPIAEAVETGEKPWKALCEKCLPAYTKNEFAHDHPTQATVCTLS